MVDISGCTALHVAARSSSTDSTDVINYLLDKAHAMDVDARDNADMTALHHVFLTHRTMEEHTTFDPAVTNHECQATGQRRC